jgi:DUF1009 family protein
MIADSVVARGMIVHIVAIEGEADSTVAAYPHTWVNLGQAARMMRALKGPPETASHSTMVIAGAVSRPDLRKVRPDLGLIKLIPRVLKLITAGGDDALLTRCIRLFESQGLHVSGIHDVAPELLMPAGQLGAVPPAASIHADIALGRAVLMALGDLDVGQGVVVANGCVLAIEGVEGTDRMLARTAALRETSPGTSGGVLIKQPKPKQERRVDLPTIGARTIAGVIAARLSGIAIAAGETLVLEQTETIGAADRAGLFIVGQSMAAAVAGSPSPLPTLQARSLSRITPSAADLADVERGVAVVSKLRAFDTGTATAVIRSHVLAVAAAEGAEAMTARVSVLRQWGLGGKRKRRGAGVVRLDGPEVDLTVVLTGVANAGLAGLALVGSGTVSATLLQTADAKGLFLVEIAPVP